MKLLLGLLHKCLFWIRDYCELICWNSCSNFSDMFLLMMKLYVHNMWKWVYCELCYVVVDLWRNSCLIDVVVVMKYCCWWFITWVFIILDLWCRLSCCWWFFVEMGWFGELCEMAFVFMFNVFLKALLRSWTCKQSLETYLGFRKSKLGILGEKG